MNEERLWSMVPYGMMLVSLAGFLLVLVNPFCCWFSPEGECSGFAFENAWKPYDGKAAGLQFFATGLLAAAVVFSWPALRAQIACCRGERVGGEQVVCCLKICFALGYFALLLGIGLDMYMDNPELVEKIIIAFAVSITALGWMPIGYVIWKLIKVALSLCKKLKKLRPLLYSECIDVAVRSCLPLARQKMFLIQRLPQSAAPSRS